MRQRVVRMPQAVNQLADLQRALRVVAGDVAKPPVTQAGHLFQQVGFDIDHPVAPAVFSGGFSGVDLVRVHGDNGFLGGEVLGTAIAEAFGAGFNGANAEGFVRVRLKGVIRDMCVIEFQARQLRQMARARLSHQ